jgi:RimJ/RimL family protein N-acetyltransferase
LTVQGDPCSPLGAVGWPVHTARLLLRRGTAEDLARTWAFRRHESVGYWLPNSPATIEEYRAVFESPGRLAKMIMVELDGAVIGELMITVADAWAQAEIVERARGAQAELGWVFDPAHAGHGYATEAVRELIRICFTDLRLHRVTANCFAGNEASWRLMERVGMRRELYTVRDSLHRSEGWIDGVGYALLADEGAGGRSEPDRSG